MNFLARWVALGSLTAFAAPAAAYPRPGRIELVSVAMGGAQAQGAFTGPLSMSPDGRYVAFSSYAPNLVAGDTNQTWDVFVRDRATGTTERVSVATDGTQGDQLHGAYHPSVSADGRYVAFMSDMVNLIPGDTNLTFDVFVRDRETGTTERVSVRGNGAQANGVSYISYRPSISADGRYVLFYSDASNLVPGDTNGTFDVYVHDRTTRTTERASVGADGAQANDTSVFPSLSADGRYIVFSSIASNLVPLDTNGQYDVFFRDQAAGSIERVTAGADGTQSQWGLSMQASVSPDGRHVAFDSDASNLVPGDTNKAGDVFVRDRATGTTERVSVGPDGAQGNAGSSIASLSDDGRYVAFSSIASNLVPRDTNDVGDVFVRDREAGTTERVSVGADGAEGNGLSGWYPSLSGDGRYIAFDSDASNLVPGDTNGIKDVFVRDRGRPVGVEGLSAVPDADRISVSGWAMFSGVGVASAGDPPGDGVPGAIPAGAELTGASITYRPEDGGLLVRFLLASLPHLAPGGCTPLSPLVTICSGTSTGAGAPGILYGLRFDLGDVRHEVRVLRAGATASPPSAEAHFALYRCDPGCMEVARLSGGIGTTRAEVLVSLPLAALGAQEGAALADVQAFTALGEAAPGGLVTFDEVALADGTIPAAQVSLGIASASTPEEEVEFVAPAELSMGRFFGTLDVSSLSEGNHRVWARACLGEVCGAVWSPITLEQGRS